MMLVLHAVMTLQLGSSFVSADAQTQTYTQDPGAQLDLQACSAGHDENSLLQYQHTAPCPPNGSVLADVLKVGSNAGFAMPHSARTALAISGGGARSATLASGHLRALVKLGILPKGVDAVSSASGGTWATSQYMFADRTSEQLLGKATIPEELTMAVLNMTPPEMGETLTTNSKQVALQLLASNPECQAFAIQDQKLAFMCLFKSILAKLYLAPFHLDSEKYMASSKKSVTRIMSSNPGAFNASMFVVPMEDRPGVYITTSAVAAPLGYIADPTSFVPFQVSPDYIGSPFFPNGSTLSYMPVGQGDPLNDVVVGGGFVESFAFGGKAPQTTRHGLQLLPAPSRPFTLADMLHFNAASQSGALTLQEATQGLVPQASYWPIVSGETARQFMFVDGADREYTAVLPLLQRKVTKMAAFINTPIPLNASLNLCEVLDASDLEYAADVALSCLFGVCSEVAAQGPGQSYLGIQVFSENDFRKLMCEFQKQRDAGNASVVKMSHVSVENTWWGIPAGLDVDIIWVYNERVTNFEQRLPAETRQEIARGGSGPFANFPFYKTSEQNSDDALNYHANQVNLLSAQAEYTVLQNKHLFCDIFACSEQGTV